MLLHRSLLFVFVITLAACGQDGPVALCADPQSGCSPSQEYCVFVEGGPNFDGLLFHPEPDRHSCQPLPSECLSDISCACLVEETLGGGSVSPARCLERDGQTPLVVFGVGEG